jgi:ribosomal RNA-processing protein 8
MFQGCGGVGTNNMQDERNTHFILFEFKKTARKGKSESEWERLMSRGEILKACEYKRR